MLEKDIKKGAKRVETLNDLQPEYKDEMGYIMLRELVELCGQGDRLSSCNPTTMQTTQRRANLPRLYREILMKEKELERIGTLLYRMGPICKATKGAC